MIRTADAVAAVAIATRNRKDELRTALRSAEEQTVPVEVLVADDGSTDGTAEMVRREFPAVRLWAETGSAGYIVRRNQLAARAGAEVIFSLDDDAAFSTPRVVEQTLRDFDHPRIGAVAIPFANVRQDGTLHQTADGTARPITAAYVGTAHAIRRNVFLELGGYRGGFVHQGEEGDLGVRMLDAGYVVRVGRSEPIFHYESPRRSYARMDYFGRRNDVLFVWHNCPGRYLPAHLAGTAVNGLLFGMRVGRPLRMAYGLLGGVAACFRFWGERKPVSAATYRLYRRMRKSGPVSLSALEVLLPPPRPLPQRANVLGYS